MKKLIQPTGIFVVFVLSIILNMLTLERGGALFNYTLIYGISDGRFSLNSHISIFAGFLGFFGIISALFLYRTTPSTLTIRKQIALVSIYINGISLIVLLVMTALPAVHFY